MIQNSDSPRKVIAVTVHNTQSCSPYRPWLNSDKRTPNMVQLILPDAIQIRDSDDMILINGIPANIDSYRIIVENLVVGVKFMDGGFEKAVLHEGDTFDLDTAIRICIAKHVGRKYYNLKGIEYLAEHLSHLKCIDKMISKVHKKMKQEQKQKAKEEKDRIENRNREKKKRLKAEQPKRNISPENSNTRINGPAPSECVNSHIKRYRAKVRNNRRPQNTHLNIRTSQRQEKTTEDN